ncbi:MAG: ABC transporter ATP-binding protein [Syntrophomonadaceae bacterium]|nr:ABC transporter ATP-binding protein [Syntrophomonadaceae bacterium]
MEVVLTFCIEVDNVDFSYDLRPVLKNNCIQVPAGCIYGILGPSGCGKTTLVKLMAGILRPAAGGVKVLGQKMPALNIMNNIGYMAQSDALYSLLSARENLEFFGAVYGLDKKRLKQRIPEVMAVVDLADELDKPVQNFSGGMKRRLSLAIALLHSPPVLILDEPTVGIDPLLRRNIWAKLFELAAAGAAIVVTTHVMDEAAHCHRLAMMRGGMLIASGTYDEILKGAHAADVEAAFLYYGGGVDES